ncbi:hypothetical protein FACS1894195_4020 [Bacteroidia bacterium]|nr:hypothetical protein FACS1894195_4020 [Bacteroidia bacterium]
MKNKLIIGFLIVSPLFYIGCGTKSEQSSNIEIEKIDFFSFKNMGQGSLDAVIKEKKYIKLDDSDDDFLFRHVDKIKIDETRIYVLDAWQNKLIVFERNGVGIGKVGDVGQGPEEYLQITDFDINEVGDIYFIDGMGGGDRLFVFNKNLQFVSVRKLPFGANTIKCLPNNKILFGLEIGNKGENSSKVIAVTNSDLQTEQSHLEYGEYIDDGYWRSSYRFGEIDSVTQYNIQADNYVYEFSNDGSLVKAYLFDFGSKNVPDKYKNGIEGNMEEFRHLCCFQNFTVINAQYILGMLWDKLKNKIFIVSRRTQKIYYSEDMADYDFNDFIGYYNNHLISLLSPDNFDKFHDLPADIKKHLKQEGFAVCLSELK